MYLCIFIYIGIHMYTFIYTHLCCSLLQCVASCCSVLLGIAVSGSVRVTYMAHKHVCMCICVYACMYVSMASGSVCVCMCVCVYLCVIYGSCIHLYVCV